jgi:heme/copper-type cytochrome/quinol oxidase subunit 1
MPRRVLDYPAALGGWHAIVSAGHLLSVAGMMAFFIMIFDSIRHSHPSHRNSLGVPRFSIRLNFYTYEAARARYLQRKGWCVSRFNKHNSVRMGGVNYTNHEYLETTLYSYAIINKPNSEYPGKRSTLTVDR